MGDDAMIPLEFQLSGIGVEVPGGVEIVIESPVEIFRDDWQALRTHNDLEVDAADGALFDTPA